MDNRKWMTVFRILALLLMLVIPVLAAEQVSAQADLDLLDGELSDADKDKLGNAMKPIVKIVWLLKFIGPIVAVVVLIVGGVTLIWVNKSEQVRADIKDKATRVIGGLMIIFGAPWLISILFG